MRTSDRIVEPSGSWSPLRFVGRPADDPATGQLDISRARDRLGWEPTADRRCGQSDTITCAAARVGECDVSAP